MGTKPAYSVAVTEKPPGETAVYRHPDAKDKLANPPVKTMQEHWNNSVKQYGDKLCLENYTYKEVDKMASSIASWLVKNGYDLIYIHSKNRAEWTTIDLGCSKYGIISVPLYDTLGKEALEYTFKITEGKVIFSSSEAIDSLLKQNPSTIHVLKKMVVLDPVTE